MNFDRMQSFKTWFIIESQFPYYQIVDYKGVRLSKKEN